MIGFRCRHSITKLESSHVGDSLVNAGLEGSGIFRSRCACILRREVILTESFDDHHQGAANGLPEDLRDHARLMCDIIAIAFQTDRTRVASLILARDLSAMYYPFREVREGHHGASHNNLSDGYERISRFHLSQLAYLATKLDSMPEGNGTVLDNSCLMFLSNLWIGRLHDNRRLPLCSLEVWAAHSRPDVRSIISMLATTTVRCAAYTCRSWIAWGSSSIALAMPIHASNACSFRKQFALFQERKSKPRNHGSDPDRKG